MSKLSKFEVRRLIKKAEQAISLLNLDLKGLTVLTEVGSNYFVLTPVIALMAGASKVFAWTRDSRFGKGHDNVTQCKAILSYIDFDGEIVFSVGERPIEHIEAANIITNSGFVRPLNQAFLQYVNPNHTVIPLMYEAWELRPSDIDINYCQQHHIRVAGTWENHPALKVFSSTGPLAVKMVMEAKCEVYQNNIIIWSDDHFGTEAKKSFEQLGANQVILTTKLNTLKNNLASADLLYICDYNEKRPYFGECEDAIFDIHYFKVINPALQIVHLYGKIDYQLLKNNQFSVYPPRDGSPSIMTFTLAHLGMTPLIRLQAGGLKVGTLIHKNQENKLAQIIT